MARNWLQNFIVHTHVPCTPILPKIHKTGLHIKGEKQEVSFILTVLGTYTWKTKLLDDITRARARIDCSLNKNNQGYNNIIMINWPFEYIKKWSASPANSHIVVTGGLSQGSQCVIVVWKIGKFAYNSYITKHTRGQMDIRQMVLVQIGRICACNRLVV